MAIRYPDSKNRRSIEDGDAFEECVIHHLDRAGWHFTRCQRLADQIRYGDAIDSSGESIEIKLDARCLDTGRLSIEIEEKTALARGWVPSGIFAQSSAIWYCQGTMSQFWVFFRNDLRTWYEAEQPAITDKGTIKTFYIPIVDISRDLRAALCTPTPRNQALDTLTAIAGTAIEGPMTTINMFEGKRIAPAERERQALDTLRAIARQKPINREARRQRALSWIVNGAIAPGYPYEDEP